MQLRELELVRNLFEYAIAYTHVKTPCARNIVQQPWSQYLGEVPHHETIQFTPPASSDSASGWVLLKVGRAKLTEHPQPPDLLIRRAKPLSSFISQRFSKGPIVSSASFQR